MNGLPFRSVGQSHAPRTHFIHLNSHFPLKLIKEYTYRIHEVAPYINWLYFFHAWGFQPKYSAIAAIHGCDCCRATWLTTFSDEERPKAEAAMQLFKEAGRMVNELDTDFRTHGVTGLFDAVACDDDIIVKCGGEDESSVVLPFLRQQHSSKADAPLLCLSDFIRPESMGEDDRLGIFATTVDADMEHLYEEGAYKDDYKHLLAQTLADRLAEATAEKMHEEVRKELWGYAPDEHLSMEDLLAEHYQGIRPAVGYPSIPDQTFNFLIDKLLHFSTIGISLTENGAMRPHASVSGLMFAHPQARYFTVGQIGEDQLADYARRRGKSVAEMRKFLAMSIGG